MLEFSLALSIFAWLADNQIVWCYIPATTGTEVYNSS